MARRTIAKKKPSLGPSKLRMMPVRRISYLLPLPYPILPASTDDRVNMPRPTAAATNTKSFLQPRRASISLRLPQTSTAQFLQPKRRLGLSPTRWLSLDCFLLVDWWAHFTEGKNFTAWFTKWGLTWMCLLLLLLLACTQNAGLWKTFGMCLIGFPSRMLHHGMPWLDVTGSVVWLTPQFSCLRGCKQKEYRQITSLWFQFFLLVAGLVGKGLTIFRSMKVLGPSQSSWNKDEIFSSGENRPQGLEQFSHIFSY